MCRFGKRSSTTSSARSNTASSRLPEPHTSRMRSPSAIGQPPTSTSRVAVRASANCGDSKRRNSSTAVVHQVRLVAEALAGVAGSRSR